MSFYENDFLSVQYAVKGEFTCFSSEICVKKKLNHRMEKWIVQIKKMN